MFQLAAGLSSLTQLVVNVVHVHPSKPYVCMNDYAFEAFSVDVRVDRRISIRIFTIPDLAGRTYVRCSRMMHPSWQLPASISGCCYQQRNGSSTIPPSQTAFTYQLATDSYQLGQPLLLLLFAGKSWVGCHACHAGEH